uniref:Uncharacterized protein n=1 Tax=Anguilla anguilla TaxID=7936 RepID=A0A0E9WL27_ANGAN
MPPTVNLSALAEKANGTQAQVRSPLTDRPASSDWALCSYLSNRVLPCLTITLRCTLIVNVVFSDLRIFYGHIFYEMYDEIKNKKVASYEAVLYMYTCCYRKRVRTCSYLYDKFSPFK